MCPGLCAQVCIRPTRMSDKLINILSAQQTTMNFTVAFETGGTNPNYCATFHWGRSTRYRLSTVEMPCSVQLCIQQVVVSVTPVAIEVAVPQSKGSALLRLCASMLIKTMNASSWFYNAYLIMHECHIITTKSYDGEGQDAWSIALSQE